MNLQLRPVGILFSLNLQVSQKSQKWWYTFWTLMKRQNKQCKMRGRSESCRGNSQMHVSSGEQYILNYSGILRCLQSHENIPSNIHNEQKGDSLLHLSKKREINKISVFELFRCASGFPPCPKKVSDSNYSKLRWLSIRAWYNQNQWICHCLITVLSNEDRPIK